MAKKKVSAKQSPKAGKAPARPARTSPATSGTSKTTGRKPADEKPADIELAETKTAETKTAETKTAETKTADSKTAETKPAEQRPAKKRSVVVASMPAAADPSQSSPAAGDQPREALRYEPGREVVELLRQSQAQQQVLLRWVQGLTVICGAALIVVTCVLWSVGGTGDAQPAVEQDPSAAEADVAFDEFRRRAQDALQQIESHRRAVAETQRKKLDLLQQLVDQAAATPAASPAGREPAAGSMAAIEPAAQETVAKPRDVTSASQGGAAQGGQPPATPAAVGPEPGAEPATPAASDPPPPPSANPPSAVPTSESPPTTPPPNTTPPPVTPAGVPDEPPAKPPVVAEKTPRETAPEAPSTAAATSDPMPAPTTARPTDVSDPATASGSTTPPAEPPVRDLSTVPADDLTPSELISQRKSREELRKQVDQFQGQGAWDEALAAAEKTLAIDRQVYPDVPEKLADSLTMLAQIQEQRGDYQAARPLREEALALYHETLAEDDWRLATARVDLDRTTRLLGLDDQQRQRLMEARALNDKVLQLYRQEQFEQALETARQVMEIRGELLGLEHVDYAQSLNNVASLLLSLGRHKEAEPLFRQAVAIRAKALGPGHPDYQNSVDNLAALYVTLATNYEQAGDLDAAKAARGELVSIRTDQFGEQGWQSVDAALELKRVESSMQLSDEQRSQLSSAGELSQQVFQLFGQQKLAEAVEVAGKVVELRRGVLGSDHLEVADSLVNLAILYDRTGKAQSSGPIYQEALDIYQRVLGKQHPRRAAFVNNLASSFENAGDFARAESLYREALAVYAHVFGVDSPEYQAVHGRLTNLLRGAARSLLARADFAAARQTGQQALDLIQERFGDQHWQTSDAGLELARIDAYAALDETQRNKLIEADQLTQQVVALYGEGRAAEALAPARQAMEVREQVLGPNEIDTAESINNLAAMHYSLGDYSLAEPLYRRAARIREQRLGKSHPAYATSMNNLAELYRVVGEFGQAEPLYLEALEISRRWQAESPADYATSLNNLGLLYHTIGRYEEAEPLYQEAIRTIEPWLQQFPRDYSQSLNNLAGLFRDLGDSARAEPLYLRALDIQKQLVGDTHADYANSLNNLANLYHQDEKYDQAEPLYDEALAILAQQEPVRKDRTFARTLSNLAGLYHETGRFDESGQRYQQVVDILRETLGEEHPDFAISLGNLAAHDRAVGKFAEAEPLYLQALASLEKAFGKDHRMYAGMLRNLAKLYDSQGQVDKATPLLKQSLQIARQQLDQMAAVQSERQQLAMAKMFRGVLDSYLSLSTRGDLPVDDVYSYVLRWKGSVFTRQLWLRQVRRIFKQNDDPEVARMIAELESTACRIATIALSAPAPSERARQLDRLGRLTEKKEQLETELSRRSNAFREQHEQAAVTPQSVQQALGEGVVLIDFLEYAHAIPPPEGKGKWTTERRLMAFVVRADKPIKRLDMGPVAPIAEAVTLWRGTIKRTNPIVGDNDPAVMLRRTVWEPIEAELADGDQVLVSTDGALARMPLAALPGRQENTYLIEERAIAVIPVPQLLPHMGQAGPDTGEASMLLLGEVDFDAGRDATQEGTAGSRGGGESAGLFGTWKALPETRTEIVTIGDSFELKYPDGKVRKLRRHLASEENVRSEIGDYRWVHLATHGFFAPPERHSALAAADETTRGGSVSREADVISNAGIGGFHPGVLSGVVLAGVNAQSADGQRNGVLTAMEVSQLDLSHVEVVVLSACETGLGEVAGGEGVLGLHRAFQLAGAKTTVTSLWTVDDLATQLLMVHFYDQLWLQGKKKIGKLEAFRQSQLMLLREGPKRGFMVEEEDKPKQPARTAPFYWAAFSISGDWR